MIKFIRDVMSTAIGIFIGLYLFNEMLIWL